MAGSRRVEVEELGEAAAAQAFMEEPVAVPQRPVAGLGGMPGWFRITSSDELPDWAQGAIPEGVALSRGTSVFIVRIKKAFLKLDRPQGSPAEPLLFLTELSLQDEDSAIERARGRANRRGGEMAKQMIRGIDGRRADWTGTPGPFSVNDLWDGLNKKGRDLLETFWFRTHNVTNEEVADFLMTSLVVGNANP